MTIRRIERPHIPPDPDGTFDSRYASHAEVTNSLASKADQVALDKTNGSLTAHTSDTANPHGVTKEQVGLGSVDNTADSAKPVSTATQSALAAKADRTEVYDRNISDGRYALAVHSHTQAQSHADADTDSGPAALHHTLGSGPNRAAPGNHTHSLPTSVTGHAARTGGATGSFNNTTPTGAALASVSLTLTLDPAVAYEVTGWGSAMLQAATSSTWVGCAVALNSTVGDFVGHKNISLSATPVAVHQVIVSGQASVGCTLNARNDVAGTNIIGDASLFVVAKPLRLNSI